MRTTAQHHRTAALTIPAAYLEDARSALIREIQTDSVWISEQQPGVLKRDDDTARDNRASAVHELRNSLRLLDQLLDGNTDTEASADPKTLSGTLQAMAGVLTKQLRGQTQLAPINMGAVRELADRLRWSAEQAIRIEPTLDQDRPGR
jgi:hypothetical protein